MEENQTNVAYLYNKDIVKEEAAAWIIKMDQAPLNDEETKQIQQWIALSPFHESYIHKLAKNWDSMSVLSDLAELFPIEPESCNVDSTETLFFSIKKFLQLKWLTPIALVTLLIFITPFYFQDHTHQYSTQIGQRSDVTLDDGSKVSLNTNSHIEVDFSGELRAIRLLKGEANFNVAHNPNRPFVVYAGSGVVWAVGTMFNVRYKHDDVHVVISEGTVKIYAESNIDERLKEKLSYSADDSNQKLGKEVIAVAGHEVLYNKTIKQLNILGQDELDKKMAWHDGIILFEGESLAQAVEEISRYTRTKIVITSTDLNELPIGGSFNTTNIDASLNSLSKAFDIRVNRVSNNMIYLSKR